MIIRVEQLESMLQAACDNLDIHIEQFSTIDSTFGDGDHGVTMQKISKQIREVVQELQSGNYTDASALFMDLSKRTMNVNGGSAGPLYGTIFEGFAEGLESTQSPDNQESIAIDESGIKAMFVSAVENFSYVSTAKVGDKTMVDSLVPAANAAKESDKKIPELMKDISDAAMAGAERSKQYVAKFGRARFHKEATIGTMDAGAFSLASLIVGFYQGLYKS